MSVGRANWPVWPFKVDGFHFTGLIQTDGHPVKDLNDLSRIDYNNWEQNQNRIESISPDRARKRDGSQS
ncbi:MAG TPA: hypothetical protein VN939_18275, partial [Chthoniobacterales bacterium]|nr:hypothetical protein [Chthoniobacterales bacterium]